MAIMHPKKVWKFNSKSEMILYNALKEQLPDSYEVYYSVAWYDNVDGSRLNSESDFIIVDQSKGYICIEVKGGVKYAKEDDMYIVYNEDGSIIPKRISAYEQAEKSMRYFKECYEDICGIQYKGVYGFAAAFPNYQMKEYAQKMFFRVPELTIDKDDLDNLYDKVRRIFLYWNNQNNNTSVLFVEQARKDLCNMFKRSYAIEASKGALIDIKNKELEMVNEVQENIIMLLQNYKTFAMKGAAGTGKSWIAYKMACKYAALENRKTLLLNKSSLLCEYFKNQFDITSLNNLELLSFDEYLKKNDITDYNNYDIKESDKYGVIIVDEAQDFDENEAFFIRSLLDSEETGRFYIFYDDSQNIYSNNLDKTIEKFMIDTKPYVLTENLRNTKNIYQWAKDRTRLGTATFSNQIDGPDPTNKVFRTTNQIVKHLSTVINTLVTKDEVPANFINIVVDDELYDEITGMDFEYKNELSNISDSFVGIFKTSEYKGLEANVIFYVHKFNSNYNFKYVGLTRARFFLYDIEFNEL